MLEHVQEYLESLTQLAMASPWLLAVLVAMAVVDALLPVVPSEALIIAAGVAAAAGEQNLLVVTGAAALGSFIGETAGYLIGRRIGPAARNRLTSGSARATAYDRIAGLIATRGGTVLISARFLPGGRTVATLTAGAVGYPTGRFLLFTAVGTPLSAGWSAVLGYLGGATFAQSPLLGLAFGLALGSAISVLIALAERARNRAATPPAATPAATPAVLEPVAAGPIAMEPVATRTRQARVAA